MLKKNRNEMIRALNVVAREEASTPNVIGDISTALVMLVK